MTQHNTRHRRTVLRTLASCTLALLAGCTGKATQTDETQGATGERNGVLNRVAIEQTTLVVELANDDPDVVNLIEPNGELWKSRDVATGVERVSFEIGTSYTPGEHRVLAVKDDESIAEVALTIRPQLEIVDVGLFRNHPEKPWEEVYGESETNRKKDGEAFVTIANSGTGPDTVTRLRFDGDLPNQSDDSRGSGLYGRKQAKILPTDSIDLYSSTYPFGPPLYEDEVRCSEAGTEGVFTVKIDSDVSGEGIEKQFAITYSGSEDFHDCDIEIKGVIDG
ncbi:hypothetical protein SAMN04487950_0483 [Halogranum rubrum]|uniref:Uncharacterized protein n=1 Tax=Halogranum rubrum TaxID=553466 RepID=A0A1I4BD14_9EURY|nr:hypothetical protein [Halogranum rubrum]SFK66702.1 hypothetical protein SAMN04487950_0483 [Halogranum rubrum]